MTYMDFGFKNSLPYMTDLQFKCIQKTEIPEWITKGKTTNPKRPLSNELPNQLQTHNVPTNDVENTNRAN